MTRALIAFLFFTACKSAYTPPPVLPAAADVALELPSDRTQLLALTDENAADGPGGPDLELSLRAAQRILLDNPNDGDALWRATRAIAYQALAKGEKDADLAATCMQYGALAVAHSSGGEAPYYYALCMGLRARAKKREGSDLVEKMIGLLEEAVKRDPKAVHAGPHRLLGSIYLQAPAWPISIGNPEYAATQLESAVALAPDWPENMLILADAYAALDRNKEAREVLKKVHETIDTPQARGWKKRFQEKLDELEKTLAERD